MLLEHTISESIHVGMVKHSCFESWCVCFLVYVQVAKCLTCWGRVPAIALHPHGERTGLAVLGIPNAGRGSKLARKAQLCPELAYFGFECANSLTGPVD